MRDRATAIVCAALAVTCCGLPRRSAEATPQPAVAVTASSYDVRSHVVLDGRALAWSFDGKRQVLADGKLLLVKDGSETRTLDGAEAPEAPPSPWVEGAGQASMSHDGRFLVMQHSPVVYDLEQNTRADLAAPPSPGAILVYRIDATGRFLHAQSGRAAFVGALERIGPKVTVRWETSSLGAQRTPDGLLWLEVPRLSPAPSPPAGPVDWIATFKLGGRNSAQLPLKIAANEHYAAALCPGGNLIAVIAKGSLQFFSTSGELLFKAAMSALRLPPGVRTMNFVDGGRALLVRAPPNETLLALVPR